ncbi:MAG TPA: guanylate kinase [Candidatus Dormibacteraeota bacterium]|nr:guanylate kinase [Candidatus Dormibacteraeota bacterium]
MHKAKLLVISGPSAGVGKDTILNMFLTAHSDWFHPLSTTTRMPRANEINAQQMNFVSHQQFEKWVSEDKFLEYFDVGGNLYGSLKEPIEELLKRGQNVILRKDVHGALAIKEKIPSALIIMLVPDKWQALEKRIRARATENEATIQKRLKLAKSEMAYQDRFDHIIVNPTGNPEKALTDLEKVVAENS